MKPLLCFAFLLFFQIAFTQYRFDNVSFKTVYWNELCNTLQQHPGYLLLDVRSRGEYEDTSSSKSLNIGHLKGATNIDIREMSSRLKEIANYRDKPVFVYCSHSQRSRRVSKLLADSGFTQVYNINGGVSNLRFYDWKEECKLLTSNLPYQIVSPRSLNKAIRDKYTVLDVRTDSAFKGIALPERRNAMGRFEHVLHIPLDALAQNLSAIPKNANLLLIDEYGGESAMAAEMLHQKGFTNLSVLFNGLDGYLNEVAEVERTGWQPTAAYHTLNGPAFDGLMKKTGATLVDVRTADEFSNKHKDGFRNIGVVKGAINIPLADWEKQFSSMPADKDRPVVVYSFGGGTEAFDGAKKLSAQGYKNVYVLLGGIFNLRWRAANIKGMEQLKDWVEKIPTENQ